MALRCQCHYGDGTGLTLSLSGAQGSHGANLVVPFFAGLA